MKNRFLRVLGLVTASVLSLGQVSMAQQTSTLPLPDPGNVTLPLEEYDRLVELAGKPPNRPEVAPLPYAIEHADMNFAVEKDGVRGIVEFEGEVFHKGVSKVPLISGMTVLDARQNGKGVPLIQENGTHTALLPGPADFSIALDSGLPLRLEAGRASFSIPAPAAGSVQLVLVIPGDHTFANLSPGLITGRKSENGHTTIEATLVPGQTATVWWATREAPAPTVPREVRFLSDEKTLVSVSEAEIRVAVLADLTVVEGEPEEFHLAVPAEYQITGVTGPSLDSSEVAGGVLTLKVNSASSREHQFLLSMERSIDDNKADAPFFSFKGVQRETGEVLVEGAGTMEITAKEGGGLKRMDVKEANPYLRSLGHFPPQAAFRYHRQPNETPTLALDWVRFPDSGVLAAVAENALVTTLVTSEGKSLTEVKLRLKNQAQPFLKVGLPPGASLVSADVAGEPVRPLEGADGSRVPLLRSGFRPTGSYEVSFVFMHSGTPFARKGGAALSLPNMDIPISVLHWEVFLPERYKVKDFGGDVIAANLVPAAFRADEWVSDADTRDSYPSSNQGVQPIPGQMGGYVTDASGAIVANARITVTSSDSGATRSATADASGRWLVIGLPTGSYKVKAEMPGFQSVVYGIHYERTQPALYNFSLNVGTVSETVALVPGSTGVQTGSGSVAGANGRTMKQPQLAPGAVSQTASENVLNLQKRVAGVLPVPVDVPRAGTSFSFVRPLVLDEETRVTFNYRSR
jgi:Carboxypeptidase regulatory-like domain